MPTDPLAGRSGAVSSDNPTYRGSWVCYINYVEVPILGCDVRSGVWQMPTFQIHLIYSPLLEKFGDEDLVPVQVFYLDHWVDQARPTFRLLVDGEIVGYSRGLAHGQRTLSFQCVANIRLFEQLYFFYMTNVDDIVASTAPDVRSSGFTQEGLLYPYSIFHQGLLVTPDQVSSLRRARADEITASGDLADEGETPATREIKTPFELAYNVVKGCIASTVPEERRALPAMNFFARHMRKTRFHNRWVRLPLLEDPDRLAREEGVFPIFKAARNDEALKAMQQHLASNLGNSGPVWSMLRQVLSMVYMEIGMISNPAAVRVALSPEGATDDSGPMDGVIVGHLDPESPLVALTPPPEPVAPPTEAELAANREVLPPDHRRDYGEVHRTNVSVYSIVNTMFQEAFNRRAEGTTSDIDEARLQLLEAEIRSEVEREQARLAALPTGAQLPTLSNAATLAQDFLDERRRRGEISANFYDQAADHAELIRLQLAELQRQHPAPSAVAPPVAPVAPASTTPERPTRQGLDPKRPLRLAQHFVKPQFMFGIAPHCNVIFPSMVERTGYDESYVNKPTRIYVNDSVMTRLLRADRNANSREFMLHALTVSFPEEADAVMHHRIDSGDGSAAPHATENGRNLLIWPREWYGGVNTARMELPSWFQMLRQFQNSRREADDDSTPTPAAPTGAAAAAAGPVEHRALGETPAFGRRGRTFATSREARLAQELAIRWKPSNNQIAASRGFRVENTQRGVNHAAFPGLRRLVAHLRRAFPAITSFGTAPGPGHDRDPANPSVHGQGRAVDLMLPVVHLGNNREVSFPDRANGDPIAAWLIQHAQEIGIQYFIWARTQWSGGQSSRKDSPYHGSSPHFDHLHVELSVDAANERTPWFQQNRDAAGVTVTPRVAPESGLSELQQTGYRRRQRDISAEFGSVARVSAPVERPNPTGVGGVPATRTVHVTGRRGEATSTAQNADDETETTGPNDFQELFRLYAQYEYLRQRYMQQQSATSLRFNPYLVPGFPCFVFDSMTTRGHIAGYLTTVSHSLSVGAGTSASMSTEISTIAARTLAEFVNDLRNDAERFVGRVTAAPAEPISEIREIIQDEDLAEIFYARLLFGSTEKARNYASFRFTEAMGYFDAETGESVAIRVDGTETVAEYEQRTRRESRATTGDETTTAPGAPAPPPAPAPEVLPPDHRRDHGEVHRTNVDVNSIVQSLYMVGVNNGAEGTETAEDLGELLRLGTETAADVRREQVNLEREPNVPQRPTLARATRRALEIMREQQARGQLTSNFVDQASDQADIILNQLAELQRQYPPPAPPTRAEVAASEAAATARSRSVTTNLDPDREFYPRPGKYADAFANYGKAMELCARPACTLEEYIRFLHAGMTVAALQAEGMVGSPRLDYAYSIPGEPDSAVYYDRISKLRPGPGTGPDLLDPPAPEELGHTTTHPITPTAITRGVNADYPQTRADWDVILLEYVRRIRDRFSPQT